MTRPAAGPGTFPALCPRGHRIIPSTGQCYTMRLAIRGFPSTGEPDRYEYVIGACADLLARRAQVREAERRMLGRAS